MANIFSREKFEQLSHAQKHKKAAELLRNLYETLLQKKKIDPYLAHHYQLLESYLSLPPLLFSYEELSNRFHKHLEESRLFLKEHNLLPKVFSLDHPSHTPFLPIDIYLDNIRSAHNVGSIIRTTEALRLGFLFFSPLMTKVDSKKIQDTAMGTLDKVSCTTISSLSSLKRPLIALETTENALSIFDYIFPQSFSILLGNEEYGLSNTSLEAADILLKIPMYGFKNSLNVACAFSLIAGEIRRQQPHL